MSITCSFEGGAEFEVRPGETLLKACRRAAIPLSFSCGAGVCQTCMLRAVRGRVPPRAQHGLSQKQRDLGCLLACQCRPEEALVLAHATPAEREAGREREAPASDPQLWRELGDGRVVRSVLEAFYAFAYEDPRLGPFFHGITRERSVEKQYSFLKQLMTGERVYFGDRPRNAHHWMVISDELFDYRRGLMQDTLAAHGVTPEQAARWDRLEEHYRSDIVKAAPRPRMVDGIALPLDGYAREVLGEATVCDHCGEPLAAGVAVSYHLRLGTVSCATCSPGGAGAHA